MSHNGFLNENNEEVQAIDINNYPAVKEHLDKFWDKLSARQDKGITPYNLRSCIYMEDFFRPKIIWGEISDRSKFAFDKNNYLIEATSFIMTGEKLKYLLGQLNSKLLEWHFNQIGTATGVGTNRWKKYTIGLLPIKRPSAKELELIENLIDKILLDPSTNLMKQLDNAIYELYNLSEEEIQHIENVKI